MNIERTPTDHKNTERFLKKQKKNALLNWDTALTSDLVAEVARIATGRNPEYLACSKAAKELDRRLPVGAR